MTNSNDSLSTILAMAALNSGSSPSGDLEDRIEAVEAVVPAQATAQNQLADKAFVNSTWNEKEDAANKVTSLSASSTDAQYPSAKCVYDLVGNIETALQEIRGV